MSSQAPHVSDLTSHVLLQLLSTSFLTLSPPPILSLDCRCARPPTIFTLLRRGACLAQLHVALQRHTPAVSADDSFVDRALATTATLARPEKPTRGAMPVAATVAAQTEGHGQQSAVDVQQSAACDRQVWIASARSEAALTSSCEQVSTLKQQARSVG